MPMLIGKSTNVVKFGGLTIDELAGNVASKNDTISIAKVEVSKPTSEPWLTIDYDEWICILKGKIVIYYDDGNSQLEGQAGDTIFVRKGERFRPVFPSGGVEYIPVCLPAFRPDRCIREEEGADSSVSDRLASLHAHTSSDDSSDLLYHMCPKASWEAAKSSQSAYFPETFIVDGYFTHATAVPSRLIETANHFYQSSEGDWICLRLTRSALLKFGIVVKDEEPKPVGDTLLPEGDWQSWICPHILGGIPVQGVVLDELPILREGGRFLSILGV
mmetsp:Transcript_17144/g.24442  ORF Transcript_17144/g.24442 Transcript_17144/m.24442 type:complete len:274 (+) Transcript_17144:420-1241(+)|eukprot:CAMPEP_0172420358 /NCGR_PEP_ID=MMETSP1064-20121228/6728_1 /TAXON_ID=202472 /ORGANISM="Aulacoseira subarctica , Strain CCAP 1002/5" /LENGTH=273 /DNA_ID=CAMNT_0013160283 /DNA_START=358 /DNA_END=1179 /DNA_ORIENTATION=+